MCFMAIYGILHIQAGDNPRILWDTMTSIMPKDVVVDFMDYRLVDVMCAFSEKTRRIIFDNLSGNNSKTLAEIVICINPHTNFLMLAMEMVGQKEKKLETRKKDCDTLINMLHSYKDHLKE